MSCTVLPLLCLEDNYSYLLVGPGKKETLVVDPADGERIWACILETGGELAGILVTHHHFDHVAGIEALLEKKKVPVYGPETECRRIPHATRGLGDGEQVDLEGIPVVAGHVPGHTLGHLVYRCEDALFSGDALFLGGCGRLFEGTAEQLCDSLYRKILPLPDETRLFPGHEYTVRTRSFCRSVDPENPGLEEALREARSLRGRGLPTVPGLMGTEKETNVFLRCDDPALVRSVQGRFPDTAGDRLSVFSRLRSLMDVF